jgi:hypothetical protein
MQGDNTKAKTAYQDFLTLWKDADPDIPVLKQAKGLVRELAGTASGRDDSWPAARLHACHRFWARDGQT